VCCSILGMNLFGGKFCVTSDKRQCNCAEISAGSCRCERKNFDSLLWAIVTVFQVRCFVDCVTVGLYWNKCGMWLSSSISYFQCFVSI